MVTAEQFLNDFAKDIIDHPLDHPALIKGWAKHMEAREEAIRQGLDVEAFAEESIAAVGLSQEETVGTAVKPKPFVPLSSDRGEE